MCFKVRLPLAFVGPAFWLIFSLLACGPAVNEGFMLVSSERSGIDFVNRVEINDTLNILTTEFVYNGGGVAVGDLNHDGLDDIFFTGNMVDNRLYLNRGNLQFEDVTGLAGCSKGDFDCWSSGISIIDINADGLNDIYICNTFWKDSTLRRNLLYINQGADPKGIPIFKEEGRAYHLDDHSHSSHAQFFDYDNDGDLDVFIGVNVIEAQYPTNFVELTNDGTSPNRDRLFRNDWDDVAGHPVFTDVSLEAGLVQDGYSHSTLIHDFNEDGWQDIYVANDYFSNDLILINNRDGTFTNQAGKIFKHFSLSSMGSDVADINNDGQADFFTSEMQPYYNKRKKLFQGESNYLNTINTIRYGYDFQYTRNTLQLNRGTNPQTGLPVFAEIGLYAGVMETDWSWTALFADYNNDGWKDLYVANGFPKDVTDRDFSDFRATSSRLVSHEQLYAAIPEVKSPNFMFVNNGDLTFTNRTREWGMQMPSFSYGAACADLDQDGDLDLVVNNIDDPAFLWENTTSERQNAPHFLRVILQGSATNPLALGAQVSVYAGGLQQISEARMGRGYLSQSEMNHHFGLGRVDLVDSLVVFWPDGKVSRLLQITADQTLQLDWKDAEGRTEEVPSDFPGWFDDVAARTGLQHTDQDPDFIDFNFQRTLPHKFSQYGPAVAITDVNGDGLEDVLVGAGRGQQEVLFLANLDGTFSKQSLDLKQDPEDLAEDAGMLFFDADGDADPDLYIARGSGQYEPGDPLYRDVLYLNDGTGHFTEAGGALPTGMLSNSSCVKAADFDRDGDLDLFVGSRVLPRSFPLSDRSYLLRNDSEPGSVRFTDVTASVQPDLVEPGMISDALWTDYNQDGWPDLMLAGEWMPLTLFANQEGKLINVTDQLGLTDYPGWWNSLHATDLDNDGDMDYLAGNYGENLYFKCTSDEPIRVYGKDLDQNGSIDPLISCFWQDSLGERHEYLYHPRQDLIKQFVGIRKKYNTYGEFGEATVPEMFSEGEMADALILSAKWMKSSMIINQGAGKFIVKPLPVEAQWAPVFGIQTIDVNSDGMLDILMVGNDHGMEVQQGRADAFNGLVLLNQGSLEFTPIPLDESHFVVAGDARALASLQAGEQELLLATQHSGDMRVFSLGSQEGRIVPLQPAEVGARVYLENGGIRQEEFAWGDTYMAQSGRHFTWYDHMTRVVFTDVQGEALRTIDESWFEDQNL